jgi:Type I phosphodiesterase / nucleotide pyrophosphatase
VGASPNAPQSEAQRKTHNVFLIVLDGVRWQEVFTGADNELLDPKAGAIWGPPERIRHLYWRATPEERRVTLFPFLWSVVAKQGQLFGNRNKGSDAHVTNGLAFSYPGYNEMLTGRPDPRIDSNEFGLNPNTTVFEWLDGQPEFRGKVFVYGTWDTYHDIFNQPRSKLPIHTGRDLPYAGITLTAEQKLANQLYGDTTRLEDDDVWDALLQVPLLDCIKQKHPRVLFVGYGEADNWAHSGRYDQVLWSVHEMDRYIAQLWNAVQSIPGYRGSTTFLITADHGRGSGPVEWKDHGKEQKGSENIWLAVIGPDTPALGERSNNVITQSQIAATVAALLGKDYHHDAPNAAPAISDVISK